MKSGKLTDRYRHLLSLSSRVKVVVFFVVLMQSLEETA